MPPRLPASSLLPDYQGGSIANLMASIAGAFGPSPDALPPLRLLPAADLRRKSSVLLLVVDGLGLRYLQDTHPGSTLRQYLRGSMTSVFPSTTATAITTFMTGLAPAQHALTGWHMYLDEIDTVGAILPFRSRPSAEPLSARGLTPEALFDHAALADRLPVRCTVISPERIVHSEFNAAHAGRAQRVGYGSLTQFFQAIELSLRERHTRKFVYAYYPELDSTAHDHGIASRHCAEVFRRFDEGFARLLSALAGYDVTVLVCADHGFVDADASQRVELDDHPFLEAALARPLCGEQRLAYAYVEADKREAFEHYLHNELADRVSAVDSRYAIEAGWFGPGRPHHKLASRVGDYLLVPHGRGTIKDWMPGEQRYTLVGVHGGLTEDEMLVPLVVVTL
jgi:hypothetical protein